MVLASRSLNGISLEDNPEGKNLEKLLMGGGMRGSINWVVCKAMFLLVGNFTLW